MNGLMGEDGSGRVSRLAGVVLCLMTSVLGGADAGHAEAPAEEPSVRIVGFLTQAYGKSDLGSILGTTEGGTTDLRNVAVQFRWEKSERDTVVVQLSHEKRGGYAFIPEGDEVEVDWAFYERRFGEMSHLRVGRLNIPLGIYNEVRDVGTLLPFFDLPISFYAGVLSSAETVDGASYSHTFAPRSSWALEAVAYVGGWDTFQQRIDPTVEFGVRNVEARAEEGLGAHLWLQTPVDGLRLGAGALTWLLDGPLSLPGPDGDRWKSFHASLDLTRERWVVRAERRSWRFDQDFGAFLGLPGPLPASARRDGFYAQVGYWVTPKVGLFAQFDDVSLKDNAVFFNDLSDFHRDVAMSVNYRYSEDLRLKIEFHDADTRFPLASPEVVGGIGAPPVKVQWAIASLSVSF